MESGGDLLSRAVSSQVPSALKGLTSVFGMGTGGTPSPLPPEIVSSLFACSSLSLAHASRYQPVGRFRVANLAVYSLGLRSAFAHRTCPRYLLFLWRLSLLPAFALPSGLLTLPATLSRVKSDACSDFALALLALSTPLRFHTLTTAHIDKIFFRLFRP